MKIAIDVSHYNKLSGFGIVTRGLVDALMKLDTKNTYYFLTNVKIDEQYIKDFDKFQNGKLIVCESNYISYKLFGVTKILKEKYVDLYISLDQQLPLRKVCKYYCISHDILPKIIGRWKLFKDFVVGKLKFSELLYYGLPFEEYSYFLADKIFTPSKNTKNDLKKILGVKSDKIIVLHRGIDHLINDNSKKNKENYILFPFPNNPTGFYFILANKIIENGLCDEVKILKPTGKINETLNDKVKIIKERISDSNLIKLYKNAKISIYISDYDGFGFPPLESIFYGTPVIYKNHSCMTEIVGKGGVSIDYFDIDKFIDEIKKFDNIDYYNRQQKEGNGWIIQYKWKSTAEILLHNL